MKEALTSTPMAQALARTPHYDPLDKDDSFGIARALTCTPMTRYEPSPMMQVLTPTLHYDPLDKARGADRCRDDVSDDDHYGANASVENGCRLDRARKAVITFGAIFLLSAIICLALPSKTKTSAAAVDARLSHGQELVVVPGRSSGSMHGTYASVNGKERNFLNARVVQAGSGAMLAQAPFTYNETVAKMMAALTRVAFCGDCVTEWTCEAAKEWNIEVVPGTSRQIVSEYMGDPNAVHLVIAKLAGPAPLAGMCLVSFSGSRGSVDSLIDADFPLWDVPLDWRCPGCKAASGWSDAWLPADPFVAGNLTEIGCANSKLAFTGHSMGSALATLAAWTLKVKHNFQLGLFYNFESPRVLDTTFAREWEGVIAREIPAFRITRYLDPVVHLPPVLLGYRFAPAAEVYYGQSGSDLTHTVCTKSEDCDLLDSATCDCSSRDANIARDLFNGANHCGNPGQDATTAYPLVSNGNICSCW